MKRNEFTIAAVVLAGVAAAGPAARAQTDATAMARRTATNQLGLLEYCRGRGAVAPDAIDAQKTLIARLPSSTAGADDAEAAGEQGSLMLPDGSSQTLAAMVAKTDTTVPALCARLGEAAVRGAAMYKGGAMPAMPGGMQMPAMPNGPQMPAMPDNMRMPTPPGAPGSPPPS